MKVWGQVEYKSINFAAAQALTAAATPPPAGTPIHTAGLTAADAAKLTKRARAKYFSFALAKELATCESKLQRSYIRSLTCCSVVTQVGDKLTAQYCGARWCLVCNRIRTAKLINKYTPHLEQMHQPHFVTVTIPNITGSEKELRYVTTQMQKFSRRMFDRLRKYGLKYKGFRKIEVSFSTRLNNYHPHIHFLIDGFIANETEDVCISKIWRVWKSSGFSKLKFQRMLNRYNAGKISPGYFKAELLRESWLKEFPNARAVAQDIRPARAGTLKELFKYAAKIVSKSQGAGEYKLTPKVIETREGKKVIYKKRLVAGSNLQIHINALDNIFCALSGKRIIQPVGYTRAEAAAFNELLDGDINKNLEAETFEGLGEVEQPTKFFWRGNDWCEEFTGGRLTGFKPGIIDKAAAQAFIYDTG